MNLPKKLKKDSLIEVVCEIRFDTGDFQELTIGKLASIPLWKNYTSRRTPLADIPAPIRMHDEQLKYQALIELISPDNQTIVRIGGNSICYNNVGSYKGWDIYFSELKKCITALFQSLERVKIERLGLRYINALNTKDHLIRDIDDFDLSISVAGLKLNSNLNLNYMKSMSPNHDATIRISTPEFVTGLPDHSSALIDIDIYTKQDTPLRDEKSIISWVDEAHTFEKKEFFSLIPKEITEKIREN